MINLPKISNFRTEHCSLESMDLSFFSLKYNEFQIDFLHASRSHNCVRQDFFVPIFLKHPSVIFDFLKKQAI
jgi:hypothetical protein